MSLKQFWITGIAGGLCLLATHSSAGQPEEKGIITTLDVSRGLISIDTHDMYIGKNIRIQTAEGRTRRTRDLASRQYVRYSLNGQNEITELWIYPSDIQKLIELNYDDEIGRD